MAPPMPIPVKKRIAVIEGTDQAKTDATENTPMKAVLQIRSGLRPRRSPSGPDASAPTRMPTLDITKAMVKSGGGKPQPLDSEGAAMPMVPRSKPSKACTSAQSSTTRNCNAPNGWFSSASSTGDFNSPLIICLPEKLRWGALGQHSLSYVRRCFVRILDRRWSCSPSPLGEVGAQRRVRVYGLSIDQRPLTRFAAQIDLS